MSDTEEPAYRDANVAVSAKNIEETTIGCREKKKACRGQKMVQRQEQSIEHQVQFFLRCLAHCRTSSVRDNARTETHTDIRTVLSARLKIEGA